MSNNLFDILEKFTNLLNTKLKIYDPIKHKIQSTNLSKKYETLNIYNLTKMNRNERNNWEIVSINLTQKGFGIS